jgi:hypothetical protein
LPGSGQNPVAGICQYSNKPLDNLQAGNFLTS